ncbi:MAG: UDP-N-acetylmuramate--L-alanine ligase [Bacteroidales bacterium]|nr:UDP-N-acetylmuramate--L-alanine ligase [Bacteroidales bacterium]
MNYYFLGIGGIGMSALARYFKLQGHNVSGYDRTPSELTHQLESEGIAIHYDDDPTLIRTKPDLIVYTPAVPDDTAEMKYLRQTGITMVKRSQMLGHLTEGHKCIAVAGSHGKTTSSSLIAHLLQQSGIGCSAFLGGICKNFGSNLLVNPGSEYIVVEADEYDRSFLQLHPYYSVITATDPDHLDIYGTHQAMLEAFCQYANQTVDGGHLFIKEGCFVTEGGEPFIEYGPHHHHEAHDDRNHTQAELRPTISTYTAHGIEADYYAINVRNYRGDIYFDLRTPQGVFYDICLTESCLYNVENAVAASSVALSCGLNEYQLRAGLKSFKGIRRRFDYHINEPSLIYIDDYAHHPREIAATLESVRYLYPGKRIVGVFQPHLYSRTAEFATQFAEVLSTLDEVVLMPIYPARERPIPGVNSHTILKQIKHMSKYLCSPQQVLELVPALCPDVVLTLGAGDIDRLVPQLEQTLRENLL